MSDIATSRLFDLWCDPSHKTLAIIDENAPTTFPNARINCVMVTNRYDVYQAAQNNGHQCQFSDFVINKEIYPGTERVLYRISKEKRVVEHVVQSAWDLLGIDGELIVAGYKNEGIKTFAKRIEQAFHCDITLNRDHGQLHISLHKKAIAVQPTQH
jgi:16S rRNA (guanine1207-N2)-methyltransferase